MGGGNTETEYGSFQNQAPSSSERWWRASKGVERTCKGIERTCKGIEHTCKGIERTCKGLERTCKGLERTWALLHPCAGALARWLSFE